MVTVLSLVIGAGLLALCLWAGMRLLRTPGTRSGGMVDGLGNFIDVFDPARARSDRGLKEQLGKTEVSPSPDDHDQPVTIDLVRNVARVQVSRTPTLSSSRRVGTAAGTASARPRRSRPA